MTHAFILRFLRIPLIVSICFAAATIVSGPFHQTGTGAPPESESQFDDNETVPIATRQSDHPVDSDVSEPDDRSSDLPEVEAAKQKQEEESDRAAQAGESAADAITDPVDAQDEPVPVSDSTELVDNQGVDGDTTNTEAAWRTSEIWNGVGSAVATNGSKTLDLHKTLANLAVRATEATDSSSKASPANLQQAGASIPNISNQIVVMNPQNTDYSVSFVLGSNVTTLEPGESASVHGTSAQIRFDRGRGAGVVEKTLRPGHYRFDVQASGWTLSPVSHQ